MGKKLWQAGSGGLHPLVEKFTVGEDHIIDQKLLPYDIQASIAHAEMLCEIGVLDKQELSLLQDGLNEILKKWENGEFVVQQHQEDCHTAIEQFLTENYGEVGKKIHTGRSRNDQVLVMMRLFMKDELLDVRKFVNNLKAILEKKIADVQEIPMPGYTHLQKAMPTTVGVWLDSYLAGFRDFEYSLESTLKIIDQNPLGSASGFGIGNFPLDRDFTTEQMGFARTQKNPMYCGLSRGYFENIVLQTLSQVMILAGRFANDMLLFTTSEFNFLSLPNNFTTGSSIMPQKRNYDLFEIMRGNVKIFNGYQNQIQSVVSAIGGGYQRDLQLLKKPFVDGVELCEMTLGLLGEVIVELQVNEEVLKDSMTDDLFVTNEVYELVKNGMSFREAYIEIKNGLV